MNNLFTLLNDGHNPFIKGAVYRPMHHYGRGGLGYHPMRMIKGGSGTSTEIVVKPSNEISTITPRRQMTQDLPDIPDIQDVLDYLKNEEEEKPIQKIIKEKKSLKNASKLVESGIHENTKGKLNEKITSFNKEITNRKSELLNDEYNNYVKTVRETSNEIPASLDKWKKWGATKTLLSDIYKNDEVIKIYLLGIENINTRINEINEAVIQKQRREAHDELEKEIKDLTKKYDELTKKMSTKHKKLLARINTLTKKRDDIKQTIKNTTEKYDEPTKQKRSQTTINNFETRLTTANNELVELETELKNTKNELVNLESVTEIDPEVYEITKNLLSKEKQLAELLAGGPIPEAKPDYYETLIQQEEESNIQLSEEERNVLVESKLGSIIDTSIEYYTEKQNEYKNAPDFPELSEQNIEAYAKKYGIENNKAFEALSVRPDITAKIISLIDPSYKLSEIKNLRAINTGKANKDDKFGEIIDEKGKKRIFKKDDNAPFDLIVIFEYKGKTVKIVIEDKFYNNSNIHTTIKGVKGGKSVVIKYDELMNFTNNEYKKYKDVVLFRYSKAKEKYDFNINLGLDDNKIKEIDREVYNQYHGLRNKICNNKNKIDNDKITQEYFRDRYTAAIPMKMTKSNFQYPESKLIESGITNEDYYTYVKEHLTSGRKQVIVNDEGVITDIVNAGSKTRFAKDTFEQIGYDLFIGAKILYCVSLKDALLGMNWSDMIANDPNLLIDPFYKFKPVATAYGPEKGEANTDSMGLTFNVFKILARYRSSSTPVSKQTSRSNTSRSNISRVLDV